MHSVTCVVSVFQCQGALSARAGAAAERRASLHREELHHRGQLQGWVSAVAGDEVCIPGDRSPPAEDGGRGVRVGEVSEEGVSGCGVQWTADASATSFHRAESKFGDRWDGVQRSEQVFKG